MPAVPAPAAASTVASAPLPLPALPSGTPHHSSNPAGVTRHASAGGAGSSGGQFASCIEKLRPLCAASRALAAGSARSTWFKSSVSRSSTGGASRLARASNMGAGL
ncbi:MAG: hypothetical protein U1F25_11440 [Rubrivivax sp.]